jgi:O-antigen/teichoic acid export membrane protein
MLASVNCPIYVAIAVFAPEIVSLMLGEKWESSTGPMLRLFACWALLRSVGSPVGSLMFANGKVNLAFKWNFGLLFFIGPIAWAGAQFGLQGMAIGMVLLMIGLSVPMWYLFVRPITGIFFHEYIGQIAIPLLLSLVAGLCGYYSAAPFDFAVTRLPLGLTVGGLIYCFGSWWFNRVWVNAIFDLVFVRM